MAALSRAGLVAMLAAMISLLVWGVGPAIEVSDSPGQRAATALLRVYTVAPSVLESPTQATPPRDAEAFRNTMVELFKSHFVIAAALRPQEIAQIEQIRSATSPVEWVRERLDVGFLENSEIMRVRFSDADMKPADQKKLVDTLVQAFMREVVQSEHVEKLRKRDQLQQIFAREQEELRRDREEYIALAEELGDADSSTGKVEMEMLMETWRANRADRRDLQTRLSEAYVQHQFELVEAGAYRLSDPPQEGDAAQRDADEVTPVGPADGSLVAVDEQELDDDARRQVQRSRTHYAIIRQVYSARMQQLDAEAKEIAQKLRENSKGSAVLQTRREDMERQAELVDGMGRKLALWNVEMEGGSRVTLVQQAVIEASPGE